MLANGSLLIETYMSFKKGINDTSGKAKEIFTEFFQTEEEFAIFKNTEVNYAERFYNDIRCGILHQGETKNGWTITRKKEFPLFDKDLLKINAFKFDKSLKSVLKNYYQKLKNSNWDDEIWLNFRKKMLHIICNCQKFSVVILGWGSLIWNFDGLKIISDWQKEGPFLPIEFARISMDGKLTLVIKQNSKKVPVLWNLMEFDDLQQAREDLRIREKTPTIENIGFVNLKDDTSHSLNNEHIINDIKKWAKINEFDAVIWTDLPENFETKLNKPFSLQNIIDYFNSKKQSEIFEKIKEYILKTPKQIETTLRNDLENYINE